MNKRRNRKAEALPGKLPCLRESECGSSDARVMYSDGTSYCFSCTKYFPAQYGFKSENPEWDEEEQQEMSYSSSLEEIEGYDCRGVPSRGITKEVMQFFGCKVGYDSSGAVIEHYYPYGVTEVTGYKIRQLPKTFMFNGTMKGLFGQLRFNTGQRLIITEGEIDAMTVATAAMEKYKKIYPVVSISSAANTKELLAQRDWIRGFEEVIIWFDDDEPGRKAAEEAAKIIGGVVKIVKSSHKDASDVFMANVATGADGRMDFGPASAAVMDAVFRAKRWSPAGIVSSSQTWEAYKSEKATEYIPYAPCLAELNKKIYGRRLGSVAMFTSGTGMGKTLLLKEDQYHLFKTRPADERIGVLSLEESIHEAVINIMALEASKRIQLPDVEMDETEERRLWEATMADDRFMFLDHQGSVEDSSLVSKMEFMALSGCKYIYLDHVTIAVSESEGGDNVNASIDKLMSDLLKLAKRCNVWIGVVSHLRKMGTQQKSFEQGAVPTDDDLKGSGALKQVPMQIIAISRNKMEEDPVKMHTSKVWILKDRYTGRTGAAGAYIFDEHTGRLNAVSPEDFEPSESF